MLIEIWKFGTIKIFSTFSINIFSYKFNASDLTGQPLGTERCVRDRIFGESRVELSRRERHADPHRTLLRLTGIELQRAADGIRHLQKCSYNKLHDTEISCRVQCTCVCPTAMYECVYIYLFQHLFLLNTKHNTLQPHNIQPQSFFAQIGYNTKSVITWLMLGLYSLWQCV